MERPSPARVLVIGSANADVTTRVERRPDPGETVTGSDVRVSPGGKGANQAAACARAGGKVTFVGSIGSDPHGAMISAALAEAGVDTALITSDRPTGYASIVLTPDGENSIVVAPGANGDLTPAQLDAINPQFPADGIVVLNLEIPLETVAAAVEQASQTGARVVVNASPAQELPPEVLRSADPLVVNETEAALLLGAELLGPSAAMALLRRGARSVLVTLGADGVAFADPSGSAVLEGFRVPVVDTTGAGDGFIGGLTARLADGDTLAVAATYATAFAALAVGRAGAQTSYPDHQEVMGLLAASAPPER